MERPERPDFVLDEHLDFLDELRKSGVVNMFAAGEYIDIAFEVGKTKARAILAYWMQTFSERHEKGGRA